MAEYLRNRKKVLIALRARDGNGCAYCREPMKLSRATVDHVIPLSRGGRMSAKVNLVLACGVCNARKGSDLYPPAVGPLSSWTVGSVGSAVRKGQGVDVQFLFEEGFRHGMSPWS